MTINVLPFRLLSDANKTEFQKVINTLLNDWKKTWFLKHEAHELQVFEPTLDFYLEGKWLSLGVSNESWVAWKLESKATVSFLELMFDSFVSISAKPSPLMEFLMDKCQSDFLRKVSENTKEPHVFVDNLNVDLTPPRCGYGSGALGIELKGFFPKQQIVFGGAVVEALLLNKDRATTNISLHKRASLLGKYKTSVEVLVGEAEVSIQDLAQIEVGDVVPLSRFVKDYFDVRSVESQKVLARAHLGVIKGHKAVQFIE